jgi:cell division protein FtsQ
MSSVLPAGPRLRERARAERRQRRSTALRRFGWVAAASAPFAVAAWLLLASPWLAVHRVEVSGEVRLSAAQVLAAADVARGTPLARVDTGAVAARVRALGPVASVSVTRHWPGTLRVEVVERVPVAAAPAASGGWTLYDATGAALGTVLALPPGLPRLQVPATRTADPADPTDAASPAMAAALTVLAGLPRPLATQVVAVRAATPEQVVLVLRDHRQAIWGGATDGPAKAAALTALLRMKGHVFDVSSPSVVTRR